MADITLFDIPVSSIDLADTGFRISGPGHDIEHLAGSISENGLLLPPLLLKKVENFAIVSGFRRIEAAIDSGLERITCRILRPDGEAGGQKKAAVAAVAENAFSRELSAAEQVRSVALLIRFMDVKEVAARSVSIFNTSLNTGYITALSRIHQMPEPVLDLLEQGHLSIKSCKTLISFNADDISAFLSLFSRIKVSSGNQMEIIAWAKEICALEKISLSQLVEQSPVGAVGPDKTGQGGNASSHKDMGALGKQFKAFLGTRRFPSLTKAKKKAMEQIRHLDLDKGMQITIPDNFEGLTYSLQLEFATVQEFNNHLLCLSRIADEPGFTSFVDR